MNKFEGIFFNSSSSIHSPIVESRNLDEVQKESLSKDSDLSRQASVMKGLQEEKESYQAKALRSKSDLDSLTERYGKLQQDLESSNTKLTNVTSENEEYTKKYAKLQYLIFPNSSSFRFEVLKTEYENLDRQRSEEIQQLQNEVASVKAKDETSESHTKSLTQGNISGQTEETQSTTTTYEQHARIKRTAETGTELKNPRTGNHETMQQGMLAQSEIQDIDAR